MKKIAILSAFAAFGLPLAALAESNLNSPAPANGVATSRLDFRITVPRVLFLQVGTGTSNANNTAIDLIDFVVPAANVGDGTVVAGSATSGDQTAGAVTIRVMGNGGNITLNSSTTGQMNDGAAADSVGWNRINVTAAALAATTANYTNGAIVHPAFNNTTAGGAGTATTLTATNKVVRQEGKWTFAYANQDVLAAGTYGGVGVNNGRVSYTATMP